MSIGARNLRAHLAGGGKAVNGWCSIPSTVTAELIALAGFDTVTVDMQHGLVDYQAGLAMLQAIHGHGQPTLCRVPWNEPGIIMKALDAGFGGIICPMVNTAEEARRLVDSCRYPPGGARSNGPTRAQLIHGADYVAASKDWITVLPMIETPEAVRNLDAILAVPGLDGVYIGPSDLSLSMGYAPVLISTDPPVIEAIETIRAKTKAAGKIAGIHCGSAAAVRERLETGFDLATLLTDVRLMVTMLGRELAEARGGAAPAAKAGY